MNIQSSNQLARLRLEAHAWQWQLQRKSNSERQVVFDEQVGRLATRYKNCLTVYSRVFEKLYDPSLGDSREHKAQPISLGSIDTQDYGVGETTVQLSRTIDNKRGQAISYIAECVFTNDRVTLPYEYERFGTSPNVMGYIQDLNPKRHISGEEFLAGTHSWINLFRDSGSAGPALSEVTRAILQSTQNVTDTLCTYGQ